MSNNLIAALTADGASIAGPKQPDILLIDDSMEELRRLLEFLRPHYRLAVAFNGNQGYQRALALCPALILLDVCMPGMDGFATCRRLKSDPSTRQIPVIFLSSMNTAEDRIKGLTQGGVDYISKPFVTEEVVARIRIHLDLAKQSCFARIAPPAPPPSPRNPDEVLVAATKLLISQQLHATPPLAEIASRVGTYEKKLSQVFRKQTGRTVYAFIREERINRACRLLAETDMSVQDIADHVGFQSAANFSTAFGERMRVTPKAYRQALQNNKNDFPC